MVATGESFLEEEEKKDGLHGARRFQQEGGENEPMHINSLQVKYNYGPRACSKKTPINLRESFENNLTSTQVQVLDETGTERE